LPICAGNFHFDAPYNLLVGEEFTINYNFCLASLPGQVIVFEVLSRMKTGSKPALGGRVMVGLLMKVIFKMFSVGCLGMDPMRMPVRQFRTHGAWSELVHEL